MDGIDGLFKNWLDCPPICSFKFHKFRCKALVYEPSKIKIWPRYIYYPNNEKSFVNFFNLVSFTQGWILETHILICKNCSIIFNTIIMEGIWSYLTLCTILLDDTKNINVQVYLDYIFETTDNLSLTWDSPMRHSLYSWCMMTVY